MNRTTCAQQPASPHTFHIPVMGTGFTIDTPLQVARFGITSCISMVDDELMEQLRRHHSEQWGEPYTAIARSEHDARARRITAYLNLLATIVERQLARLRLDGFTPGSELTHYYEMLPAGELKTRYEQMLLCSDPIERTRISEELRNSVTAGRIEVNIMTKLDRDVFENGEKLPAEFSDAMSALRGFALADTPGGIEFSSGLNPRLYNYAATFDGFFPDEHGCIRKQIILKVSDYRSAQIQGRYFAKRGLWVSEFRIESGLNCGGHAFSGHGHLLGCVLSDFKRQRETLQTELRQACNQALAKAGRNPLAEDQAVRITVQGGVGTAAEHAQLLRQWETDGVGWGTPFLLVPEATNVDAEHLEKLARAKPRDVHLSDTSPMGVPFWSLRNCASEEARHKRIRDNRPGSPCVKGYGRICTEFEGLPICVSSRQYQARKLAQLQTRHLSARRRAWLKDNITAKACICHDLCGGVTKKLGIDPHSTPNICCGPNIVYFKRVATLREMIDHIYGRIDLLKGVRRPHMFLREAQLNLMALKQQACKLAQGLMTIRPQDLLDLRENLLKQLAAYRESIEVLVDERKQHFLRELNRTIRRVKRLPLQAYIRAWVRKQDSPSTQV